MKKLWSKRLLASSLLMIMMFFCVKYHIFTWLLIPNETNVFVGETVQFPDQTLTGQVIETSAHSILNQSEDGWIAKREGQSEVLLSIAGFPVKKMSIRVLPDFKVIPGGQSIGIRMQTKGVLVVGFHSIQTQKGRISPGEKSGVMLGDTITHINGSRVEKMQDLHPFIVEAGKTGHALFLTILRNQEEVKCKLEPVQEKDQTQYKMGLYIRDRAAGIGTLTFYHPETMKYGALGHMISDVDTGQPIIVESGEIVRSKVNSIHRGKEGTPGEKLASFQNQATKVGKVDKNSSFGIYGELNEQLRNHIMDKGMPVTLSTQVHKGKAQILTVVENEKVEAFDVEIVRSVPQKFAATKGLVIKVTDKSLLEKTGGIVQGMSGSPIIQDGKLVGAVTHVFVNNPAMGYGIHVEWMLKEAGIDIYDTKSNSIRLKNAS